MDALPLDEAARVTGRSARELRLTIEAGDLPASRQAGRWFVKRADLDRLQPPEPPTSGPRLVEPLPSLEELRAEPHPLDELLARLEARAVEVAALREEREAGARREQEKAERLERELSATRMELEAARRRIEELEGHPPGPASRRPGMRDALNPLFERTRPEPDPPG
jgi:hypothetical protein